jgi:protein-S-isoprenylcysteine O-methyltransferase Ste14
VSNAVGAAIFFLIAPATIAGAIPFVLTGWRIAEPFFGSEISRWPAAILLVSGLAVIIDSFVRFVREGRGTPAPVAPPEQLVTRGPYRWVRNPMYLAVLALIAGQALLFASGLLLAYGVVVALAFHMFVVWYEEPTLRQKFGAGYEVYAAEVSRWMPRAPRRGP